MRWHEAIKTYSAEVAVMFWNKKKLNAMDCPEKTGIGIQPACTGWYMICDECFKNAMYCLALPLLKDKNAITSCLSEMWDAAKPDAKIFQE